MRPAPTAAMEVLLELHLQVEAEARVGNYTPHCNDQWKPKSEGFDSGHEKITHFTNGVRQNDTEACL
jgi:hypothetical protein